MKKIILNFEQKTKNFKELVQEAFNKDFLHFIVSNETIKYFKDIKRLNLYSKFPDTSCENLIFSSEETLEKSYHKYSQKRNIGLTTVLKSKEDENRINEISKKNEVDFIIVFASDWKVIPFENLIAEMQTTDTELIAQVEDIEQGILMLKTLEKGVDGIVLTPKNSNDLNELKQILRPKFKIKLSTATIKNIQKIPESERVCVDTTSILYPGEGLLVGSTAMGFVLVHAEVFETEFVNSRPFRVNAGDVSAYVLVPDDETQYSYRTNYLSELKGGKQVIIVNHEGNARIVSIGRVKIETRPMLRFELEALDRDKTVPISIICQNAETIRFVEPNGNAKSVVDINPNDEILVHLGPGATHFGTSINETIIEK